MFAREHEVARRGRWRPSAEARRQGPVAVGLETLVHRQGHSLAEAGAVMRSRGETDLTDRQLGDLLRQLPRRAPLRPIEVGETAMSGAATRDDVAAREAGEARASLERALSDTLESLTREDRLLLKLRFWHDASIADVARVLGAEQRPLYRRLERLLATLRERLAAAGISADAVRDLVEGEA
jgi:RNA polymerase sigma factor for flagellar operon FliA